MLGALGRSAVGHLSDVSHVVGSRVRPLRWLALAAGAAMALLALTEPLTAAVVLLVVVSSLAGRPSPRGGTPPPFGLCALFPLVALPLVPRTAEQAPERAAERSPRPPRPAGSCVGYPQVAFGARHRLPSLERWH